MVCTPDDVVAAMVRLDREHRRRVERIGETVQALAEEHGEDRVEPAPVNASNAPSLAQALKGVALVVVASSSAPYTEHVARAALAAGCDYLDMQPLRRKLKVLRPLVKHIKQAGRCFIVDAGFRTGMPSTLVRFMAGRFDALERANVACITRPNWAECNLSDATYAELVECVRESRARFFSKGKWHRGFFSRGTGARTVDFGVPFGKRRCFALDIEEMRALPAAIPSLRETGCFTAGYNRVADKMILPWAWRCLKVCPWLLRKPLQRMLRRALERFSKPPFGAHIRIDASGQMGGKGLAMTLHLEHEEPYAFAAAAVVACILQYLDNELPKPGLFFMGNIVEPERFMADIARMGLPHAFERKPR